MSKVGAQARKVARKPGWISDANNQKEWNDRFIGILNRDYRNSDSTISAILSNEKLAQMCAVKIRSYVDREVTAWINGQRKGKGAKLKRELEIAIRGMNAAIDLYKDRGNQEVAMNLGVFAIDLSGQLGRCKEAFATKRHGRDRAHSTLSECHSFLESTLSRRVTNVSLANLVNAGLEADGKPPKELVTEEHMRKNLATFRRNNPLWRNEIGPRFNLLPVEPATK